MRKGLAKKFFLAFLLALLPINAFAAGTALQTKIQYVGSVEWSAVAAWPGSNQSNIAAGRLESNTDNSPAVDSERVLVNEVASCTTTNGAEPTWTTTKGAITTDNTCKWQEVTGQPCVNGDTVNSPIWTASTATVLGEIIYDSTSGTCQVISARTGNTGSSKPSFSATAGNTTSDNSGAVTWTSLGAATNFGAFAAPHARILAADAATWEVATPATIYIASDHAETQSTALALAGGQGFFGTPNEYLSVSKTTAPPTSLTAGASVTTTGASQLSVNGIGVYYNGITFNASTGSTGANLLIGNASGEAVYCDTCTFNLGGTGAGNQFEIGGTDTYVYLKNPTFTFGATTQFITTGSAVPYEVVNATVAASGSVPAVLFKISAGNGGGIWRDTDFSNITGTLVNLNSAMLSQSFTLENCKLASGVAMTTGGWNTEAGFTNASFRMHNCDSGTKNYRFYENNEFGILQQETTIVDLTNPASDGTTTISWNITTTANTAFGSPYATEYLPISVWENNTGSPITLSIEMAGAQSLNNAQIWPECEVLSTSGYPLGVAVSGRAAPLASPTTWTTSTDSWGGSPAHTQVMTLSAVIPEIKGVIKCRIYVADPSITEYISPVIIGY